MPAQLSSVTNVCSINRLDPLDPAGDDFLVTVTAARGDGGCNGSEFESLLVLTRVTWNIQ